MFKKHIVYGIICACVLISCDQRPFDKSTIHFAVEAGNTNAIDAFLKVTGDVNCVVKRRHSANNNVTLLHIAVEYGQVGIVQMLLKRGANPNVTDSKGRSPLMWCVGLTQNNVHETIRTNLLELLLKNGANPNARDLQGETALMWAASFNHPQMIGFLVEANAEINATNYWGNSALHLAASSAIADLLIRKGSRIDLLNISGETAAQTALREGREDVFKEITKKSTPGKLP